MTETDSNPRVHAAPPTASSRASGRATNMAELHQLTQPLFSKEAAQQGMAVKLRETDVVVTPFGKSGTTWTQQIVHSLRTRGDMEFDDISRVVPWIETSSVLGIDLDAEQRANPRAFKSHLNAHKVPKGGRYINVMRHPADVLVSMFKFQEGWFLEPGTLSVDEFGKAWLTNSDSYFQHLLSWWSRKDDADVLFLAYERMLKNASATIASIAEFIGVPLDDELREITLKHSSIEFMLEHKDRFDDLMMRRASEELCGLPPGSDSAKVREGKAGAGLALSAETLALIDSCWDEHITSALGFANYAEMLATFDDPTAHSS